ncbi:hypothetical protein AI2795V1_4705 (plasmid) [Serratia marcescens]|uniref:hypothetical protein n=1 Tax=Serratia marcescens TaxID=615 RepID=UPI001DC097FB|nr:hypothetical protein [Serratia marcescens]CAE7797947.1 hypothetical protein AI2795V1_4705 [Serratia marcescens]CAH3929604.1 hypothetical protein AI2795V1_4705 [Serratia marcescens]
MSKYENLDAAVLRKIDSAPTPFCELYGGCVQGYCEAIAGAEGKEKDEAFRVLDRRLQALRKAGKISSTSRGWVLAEENA